MQIAFPKFGEEEIALLRECLDSKWVTQGPMTQRFEKLIAQRHSVRHALATTSCTAALHLATAALGLGPGDEVVVPAFTWITSAHCAEYTGAKAVFADIDPRTYNIDPAALEAAIGPNTRAVVAVHLFGLAADMDPILAIARRHNLAVIEDAACGIGSTYKGKSVGSIGTLGCFSFHPRKVVTTGEGGAVTTNDDGLAEIVSSIRNHGATGLPPTESEPIGPWSMARFDRIGFNLRLSDIQAAVGVAQMARLDELLTERHRLAQRYLELLADESQLTLPFADEAYGFHSFQSFVVRVNEGGRSRRNQVMSVLQAKDIATRPGTHAVHRLGYYRDKYNLKPDQFPVAAASEDTTITLPLFPDMTEQQQMMVVENLRAGLSQAIR